MPRAEMHIEDAFNDSAAGGSLPVMSSIFVSAFLGAVSKYYYTTVTTVLLLHCIIISSTCTPSIIHQNVDFFFFFFFFFYDLASQSADYPAENCDEQSNKPIAAMITIN